MRATCPAPPHMPTFHGAHSYPFGYSLFLIPVFWLLDNPYTVYKASLGIGVLLMSTLYVSLYYVLTHLLGNSPRLAMLAAFITCLSPPLLLRSNFAWAEIAYVPGFMLLVALFGTLLRYKNGHFCSCVWVTSWIHVHHSLTLIAAHSHRSVLSH